MRRVLPVIAAGLLFAASACGTARNPGSEPTVAGAPGQAASVQPGQAGAPSVDPNAALCQAVGEVYSAKLGPFATALSKMVNAPAGSGEAKAARDDAKKALGSFADEMRSVTSTTSIAEAKAAGSEAADALDERAADDKFFSGIKTGADVDKVLSTTFSDWLEPMDAHCA
jgi:hypothetical protein